MVHAVTTVSSSSVVEQQVQCLNKTNPPVLPQQTPTRLFSTTPNTVLPSIPRLFPGLLLFSLFSCGPTPTISRQICVDGTSIDLEGFGYTQEQFQVVYTFFKMTLERLAQIMPGTLSQLQTLQIFKDPNGDTCDDDAAGCYGNKIITLDVSESALNILQSYIDNPSTFHEEDTNVLFMAWHSLFHELGHLSSDQDAGPDEREEFSLFSWEVDGCLSPYTYDGTTECFVLSSDSRDSDFAFFMPPKNRAARDYAPPVGKETAAEDWADVFSWATFQLLWQKANVDLFFSTGDHSWDDYTMSTKLHWKTEWMRRYIAQQTDE